MRFEEQAEFGTCFGHLVIWDWTHRLEGDCPDREKITKWCPKGIVGIGIKGF